MSTLNRALTERRWLLASTLILSVSLTVIACWAKNPERDARSSSASRLVREVTPEEGDLLRKAELVLQRQCMDRHGFKIPFELNAPELDDRMSALVIDDEAWARKHGYGSDLRRRSEEMQKSDPVVRYFTELPPQRRAAALVAINGVPGSDDLEAKLPTGGVVRRSTRSCTSEAERKLYGDLRTWYRVKKITGNLKSIQAQRVTADSRFKSAVSRWSRCIRDQGFPYSSPAELRAAASEGAVSKDSRPKSRKTEIRAAVTEARCANQTGLATTVRQLDSSHAAQLHEKYRAEYAARRHLESTAVPRARNVLATG